MLKCVSRYAENLKLLFEDTIHDEHYWYYHGSYVDEYKPKEGTWSYHEFVSIDKKNNIIGYFRYTIDRESHYAYGLLALSFKKDKSITFANDLKVLLKDIFEKYKYDKLDFGVRTGNPIEKYYDKLCIKYGGRIVGVKKRNGKLPNGQSYDYKMYEILQEEYNKNK